MRRIRVTTILALLAIAGSDAACVHATAMELESSPVIAPQPAIELAPASCVPTAPMPIIGLKVGAPKPPPPSPRYNMPVIRLSACYLEADSGAVIKLPVRDTIPPARNRQD